MSLMCLPWPPSVNTYWRHIVLPTKSRKARSATILSEDARKYRKAVADYVIEHQIQRNANHGRLAVEIIACAPDRRARDLDNLPKGILDALKHAGVIIDDSYIDLLTIKRGDISKGRGFVGVHILDLGKTQSELEL